MTWFGWAKIHLGSGKLQGSLEDLVERTSLTISFKVVEILFLTLTSNEM